MLAAVIGQREGEGGGKRELYNGSNLCIFVTYGLYLSYIPRPHAPACVFIVLFLSSLCSALSLVGFSAWNAHQMFLLICPCVFWHWVGPKAYSVQTFKTVKSDMDHFVHENFIITSGTAGGGEGGEGCACKWKNEAMIGLSTERCL